MFTLKEKLIIFAIVISSVVISEACERGFTKYIHESDTSIHVFNEPYRIKIVGSLPSAFSFDDTSVDLKIVSKPALTQNVYILNFTCTKSGVANPFSITLYVTRDPTTTTEAPTTTESSTTQSKATDPTSNALQSSSSSTNNPTKTSSNSAHATTTVFPTSSPTQGHTLSLAAWIGIGGTVGILIGLGIGITVMFIKVRSRASFNSCSAGQHNIASRTSHVHSATTDAAGSGKSINDNRTSSLRTENRRLGEIILNIFGPPPKTSNSRIVPDV